ncbi:hypothetical protein V5O48_011989 [Marasmius crinis-equi]|uniref:Uncharacterized protein n=1 Tax=Marasmius crinis-equi TaxID=585013 RepID=A0ABR3F409_9AGAR
MKLAAAFVSLAFASSALADLHWIAFCVNKNPALVEEKYLKYENDAATQKACDAYRRRNTGGNHWDKCPDCTYFKNNQIWSCKSNNKHIGGDEFYHYCKQAGAYGSQAD